MIETLVMSSGKIVINPPDDSGPGPKTISKVSTDGDGDGYYGSIPVADFLTPGNAYAFTGMTAGSLNSASTSTRWDKFFTNGKILFVPRVPFYTGIPWTALEAAEVVYGNRTITLLGYIFKFRLIGGDINDPSEIATSETYYVNTVPWETDKLTEWGRCFTRLSNDQYASLSASNLGTNVGGTSNGTWCFESYSNGLSAVLRGANNVGGYYMRSKGQGRTWRPCLELIGQV